jgi:2-polyprenyl-6-methoxyphenol hydroxylase-like FAD-dependent oxidoreductase
MSFVPTIHGICLKETKMSQFNFDVGIIGDSPAGAATAAYLAKAGLSYVVFERELFPQPHVGESLVPSSTRVFKELSFLEQMDQASFPRKYGTAYSLRQSAQVAYPRPCL